MTFKPAQSIFRFTTASIRGKDHTVLDIPNQDAFLFRLNESGICSVVCDGLGSKSNSNLGSKLACRAVWKSWLTWKEYREADAADLIRLIELNWRMSLAKLSLIDHATTCLFACYNMSNRLVLGQLGDGVLVMQCDENHTSVVTPPREGFSEVTLALGTPHTIRDWSVYDFPKITGALRWMLVTDGIGNDLVEGKESNFLDHLVRTGSTMTRRQRSRELIKLLNNWPNTHNLDDKTIVLVWRENGTTEGR